MPKMKTKSAAKKRFRVRPGGTVKCGHAFKRHILNQKNELKTNVNCAELWESMMIIWYP